MTANNNGWEPNFPPVMQFVDLEYFYDKPWKLLQEHPDYDSAKNREDRFAALKLVLLTAQQARQPPAGCINCALTPLF